MRIGTKIYNLRTDRKMTMQQLGDLVGVGKGTIKKWESGSVKNMRRDHVVNVALALGTTPEYLLGWKEPETEPEKDRFREMFNGLTDDQKEIIEMTMRAMLDQNARKALTKKARKDEK